MSRAAVNKSLIFVPMCSHFYPWGYFLIKWCSIMWSNQVWWMVVDSDFYLYSIYCDLQCYIVICRDSIGSNESFFIAVKPLTDNEQKKLASRQTKFALWVHLYFTTLRLWLKTISRHRQLYSSLSAKGLISLLIEDLIYMTCDFSYCIIL